MNEDLQDKLSTSLNRLHRKFDDRLFWSLQEIKRLTESKLSFPFLFVPRSIRSSTETKSLEEIQENCIDPPSVISCFIDIFFITRAFQNLLKIKISIGSVKTKSSEQQRWTRERENQFSEKFLCSPFVVSLTSNASTILVWTEKNSSKRNFPRRSAISTLLGAENSRWKSKHSVIFSSHFHWTVNRTKSLRSEEKIIRRKVNRELKKLFWVRRIGFERFFSEWKSSVWR